MAAFNKVNVFTTDLITGVHNLTDSTTGQLMIALTTTAPTAAGTSTYANISSPITTGYTTAPNAGRVIGDPTLSNSSGTAKVVLPDMTITATSITTFRYIVLYNNTPTSPADPVLGWIDYGSTLVLQIGESLVIDFDDAAGLFTLA
jgi:hypothetical protein